MNGVKNQRQPAFEAARRYHFAGQLQNRWKVCSPADVGALRCTCSDVPSGQGDGIAMEDSDNEASGTAAVGVLVYDCIRYSSTAVASWYLSDGSEHVRLAFVEAPPLEWLGKCVALTAWRLIAAASAGRAPAAAAPANAVVGQPKKQQLTSAAYVEVSGCVLLSCDAPAAAATATAGAIRALAAAAAAAATVGTVVTTDVDAGRQPAPTSCAETAARYGAKSLADVAAARAVRQAAVQRNGKRPRSEPGAPPPPLLVRVAAVSPAVTVETGQFCLVELGEVTDDGDGGDGCSGSGGGGGGGGRGGDGWVAGRFAHLVLSGAALAWRARLQIGRCYCLQGLAYSRLGPYAVLSAGGRGQALEFPVEVLPDAAATSSAMNHDAAAGSEPVESANALGGGGESDGRNSGGSNGGGGCCVETAAAPPSMPPPPPRPPATAGRPPLPPPRAAPPPPAVVSYEGAVTGVSVNRMAGLYQLDGDDRLKLFTQLHPCSDLGAGLRVGGRVRLDSVHPVYLWGRLEGFGACARSSLRPTAFSPSATASYRPLLGRGGGRGGGPQSLTGYAWQYRVRRVLAAKGCGGSTGNGESAARHGSICGGGDGDGGGNTEHSTRSSPAMPLEALEIWLRDVLSGQTHEARRRDFYEEFFSHGCGGCTALGQDAALEAGTAQSDAASRGWPGAFAGFNPVDSEIFPPMHYPKLPLFSELLSAASSAATRAAAAAVSTAAVGTRTVVTVRTDLSGDVGGGYETAVVGWLAGSFSAATAAAASSASSPAAGATPLQLWMGDTTGWLRLVVTEAASPRGDADEVGGVEAGGCRLLPPVFCTATAARGPSVTFSTGNLEEAPRRFALAQFDDGDPAAALPAAAATVALGAVLMTEAVVCAGGDGVSGGSSGGHSSPLRSEASQVRCRHLGPTPLRSGSVDYVSVGGAAVMLRHYLVVSQNGLRQCGHASEAPVMDDAAAAGGRFSHGNDAAAVAAVPRYAAANGHDIAIPNNAAAMTAAAAAGCDGSRSGGGGGGGGQTALSVSDALVVNIAPGGKLDSVHTSESIAVEALLVSIEFREHENNSWHQRRHENSRDGGDDGRGDLFRALSGWQLCFTLEDLEAPDVVLLYLDARPASWPPALAAGRCVVRVNGVCRRLSGNGKNIYLALSPDVGAARVEVKRLIETPPLAVPVAGPSHVDRNSSSDGGSSGGWHDAITSAGGGSAGGTAAEKAPRRCTLLELYRRGRLVRSRRRVDGAVVAVHFAKAATLCPSCRRELTPAELRGRRCRRLATAGGCGPAAWRTLWEATATLDDGTAQAQLCLEGNAAAALLRLPPAGRALIERAAAEDAVIYRRTSVRGTTGNAAGVGSGGGGAGVNGGFSNGAGTGGAARLLQEAEALLDGAARAAAVHRRVTVDCHQLLRASADAADTTAAATAGAGAGAARVRSGGNADFPVERIVVSGRELDTLSLPRLYLEASALRETDCGAAAYAALARLATPTDSA